MKVSTEDMLALGAPVALPDGSRVRVRQWRPSDEELLKAGFYRLSPTSSYRRFLSASPVLTTAMLRELTDVDHRNSEAVLALDERGGQGLGIARYGRSPERPDVAEVALTVIDDWQDRGLGTLLLDVITARARDEGIKTFSALMLEENHRMRHLFERLGPVRVIARECGTVQVEVPLHPVRLAPALRGLLRQAGFAAQGSERGPE